jgi:hypothetical protein
MWREGSNNGQVDLGRTGYSGENRNGVDIDQDVPWSYESRNGFFTECTDAGNAGCGVNSKGYWTQQGRTRGQDGADMPAYCYLAWQNHSICKPNWSVIAPELDGMQPPLPAAVTASAVGGKLGVEFYGEYVEADDLPATIARTDVLWVFAQPDMSLTDPTTGTKDCYSFICPNTVRMGPAPQYYSMKYTGIFTPGMENEFISNQDPKFFKFLGDLNDQTGSEDHTKALRLTPSPIVKPLYGIKVALPDTPGTAKFQIGGCAAPVYKLVNGGDQYVAGYRGTLSLPNDYVHNYRERPNGFSGWPAVTGFYTQTQYAFDQSKGYWDQIVQQFAAPLAPTNDDQLKWTLYGLSDIHQGNNALGFDNSRPTDLTNVDGDIVSTTLGGERQKPFSQLVQDMAVMKCCNAEWPATGPDREELHCPPDLFAGSLACNSRLNDIGKTAGKYNSICPRYVKSDSPDFIGWGPFAPGSVEEYWMTRCGCQLDPLFYSNPNIPPECYDKRCIAKEAYKDYALYSKGCTQQNCTINLGNIVAKNSTVDISAANNCCIVKDGAQATGPYAGSKCEADIAAGGYRCAPSGTELNQCIRDPANGVVSAADCMEKCGAPAPTMYKCIRGACTDSPDGTFESMAECVAGCSAPDTKFACLNGAACIPSPTGTFNTITECQLSGCGGGVQTRYACVDGTCLQNAAGAYASKPECEAACAKVPNPPGPSGGGDSNIGIIIGASLGGLVVIVGSIMLAKKFKKK